jgi:hypothetical protein
MILTKGHEVVSILSHTVYTTSETSTAAHADAEAVGAIAERLKGMYKARMKRLGETEEA